MKNRQLGRVGPSVSALGLGCMGMSDFYGDADRDESITVIRAALDAGITLLDTGDFYGMGHNELLVGDALAGRSREDVEVSVKFGALRGPDRGWLGYDGRPEAVKTFLAYTLGRLRTDYIDVYRLARVDPKVPIEETVGAIGEMITKGYVRYVGLSEAGAETIRRAHSAHPIADLQIEYSIISRDIEDAILPACRELGIAITAYGVLSRGLLSGHWTPERNQRPNDMRAHYPRFSQQNEAHNLRLVDALRDIAQTKHCSVAQLAIAWVLAKGDDIIPLIGARTHERLAEALGALDVDLTSEDLAAIERSVPRGSAAGTRYPGMQMAHLDSERETVKTAS